MRPEHVLTRQRTATPSQPSPGSAKRTSVHVPSGVHRRGLRAAAPWRRDERAGIDLHDGTPCLLRLMDDLALVRCPAVDGPAQAGPIAFGGSDLAKHLLLRFRKLVEDGSETGITPRREPVARADLATKIIVLPNEKIGPSSQGNARRIGPQRAPAIRR